jgi:hypothetical protein
MDVRLSAEQRSLHAAAARLADDLGPGSVIDLDDDDRVRRLEKAVDGTGWRSLRSDGASGVEVALVVEEFARGLVDVPFLGPVLADDLAGAVGADGADGGQGDAWTLVLDGTAPDARGFGIGLALDGRQVVTGELAEPAPGIDLTRRTAVLPSCSPVGEVDDERAARFQVLGMVAATADMLGAARGAHTLAVEYAKTREQYGRAIGSNQGVSHPLAEAQALIEGCVSVLRHAAWGVDELGIQDALHAARVATLYTARAARTICETSIQVHGGIGNTWECLAHVHLRRVLTATALFPVRLEEVHRGLS